MKFKNLEMTGFKSFSEKTTILIEKGLTGLLGLMGVVNLTLLKLKMVHVREFSKKYAWFWNGRCNFSGTSNLPAKKYLKLLCC